MTFWFLHPWIWDRSVSASMSMVATMDGKAGRKTAARLLKKLCQRLGRQNIDFFNGTCLPTTYCSALREYDIFVSSFMDMGWVVSASMSVVAAIMDGRAGWENGRAGLCAVGRLLMVGHAKLLVNASLTRQRGPYWNKPGNTNHRPQSCLLDCSEPLQAYQGTW